MKCLILLKMRFKEAELLFYIQINFITNLRREKNSFPNRTHSSLRDTDPVIDLGHLQTMEIWNIVVDFIR